jgi:hypothetical protein
VPPSSSSPALAVRSIVPALATRSAVPAPPPAAPTGAGRLDEDKIRAVHEAFASAAKSTAGSVAVPSPAALRKSLEKELARVAQKHPGRRVDFRVDLKDGKPVIKSFVVPGKD